ncbi:MAG: hypothetical protein JXA60_04250 [Candidatus Coatesbacteria bacterium]|nr:hypothetical protein [Candidatus Coatesbacteria bacterium]
MFKAFFLVLLFLGAREDELLKNLDEARKVNDITSSIKILKTLITDNPENTDYIISLGEIYMDEDSLEIALAYFKKAIVLEPLNKKALKDLAIAYGKTGKHRYSMSCLKTLLACEPDKLDNHLLLAETYNNLRLYNESIELMQPLITKHENSIEVNFLMGLTLYQAGREQESEKYFEKVKKQNPEDGRTLFLLGELSFKKRDFLKAKELFNNAIEKGHTNNLGLLTHLAQSELELSDTLSAIKTLKLTIRYFPENAPSYVILSRITKDRKKKLQYMKKAVEISQESIPYIIELGVILETSKQYNQAARLYRHVINLYPEDYNGFFALAKLSFKRKNSKSALDNYYLALEKKNVSVSVYLEFAECLLKLNRKQEAKGVLEKGLKLFNEDKKLKELLQSIK